MSFLKPEGDDKRPKRDGDDHRKFGNHRAVAQIRDDRSRDGDVAKNLRPDPADHISHHLWTIHSRAARRQGKMANELIHQIQSEGARAAAKRDDGQYRPSWGLAGGLVTQWFGRLHRVNAPSALTISHRRVYCTRRFIYWR